MNLTLLEKPLIFVGRNYVSAAGLLAGLALLLVGFGVAHFLQSNFVRRSLSRLKMGTNFVAIITTITSVAVFVLFLVAAVNSAGVPLAWTSPLPGASLSLLQIVLLVAVFWISSRTKRFLFNKFLNDNIAMIVPNTNFIGSPVTNWTYGDPRIRFRIPVGVAYGSDVERVRAALIAAGSEHPNTLRDPSPSVFLDKFGESSSEFELVVWSAEMSHRPRRFKSDLNFPIEKKLREASIAIPNPQRDLHIRRGVLKVEGSAPLAQKPAASA